MKKKHRSYMRRMNRLLLKIMKVTRRKSPVDICAACCAVLAITYKHMDDDDREAIASTIASCLTMITGDQKRAQPNDRVH
jgi:uncharacterized protein (DUF2267 family)